MRERHVKGEKSDVDELMMDFNWGDEIEIYKVEAGIKVPPSARDGVWDGRKKNHIFQLKSTNPIVCDRFAMACQ